MQEIWWEFCGIFSDLQNEGPKNFGESFGAFFVRKFVPQIKIFRANFALQTRHPKEMGCFLAPRPSSPDVGVLKNDFDACTGQSDSQCLCAFLGPEKATQTFLYKVFRQPFGSWTSAPKIVDVRTKKCVFLRPKGGEKPFDPGASGRKGQECPREIRTKKLVCYAAFSSLTLRVLLDEAPFIIRPPQTSQDTTKSSLEWSCPVLTSLAFRDFSRCLLKGARKP